MAATARALEVRRRTVRRPPLRVVRPSSRRDTAAAVAAYRHTFMIVSTAFIVVAFLGMVRVSLTVSAMAASVDAGQLQKDLRMEQLASDRLQADRSALATPSRIESIAAEAMRMTKPADVRYMTIPQPTEQPKDTRRVSMSMGGGTVSVLGQLVSHLLPGDDAPARR